MRNGWTYLAVAIGLILIAINRYGRYNDDVNLPGRFYIVMILAAGLLIVFGVVSDKRRREGQEGRSPRE